MTDTQPEPRRCPCCGNTRVLGRYDICAPCAANEGFDPPCLACSTESAGMVATTPHVATCGPGRTVERETAKTDADQGGLSPADLSVDVYSDGSPSPTFAVRVTHRPTGKSATATGKGQACAKEEAMRQLREILGVAKPAHAYLVIYSDGPGLGWAGLDRDRAHEHARNTGSVVVKLPVIADYRKTRGADDVE